MTTHDPPTLPPGGIDCRALRPLLPLFVDGEFENGEDFAFTAHIAACEGCAREARALRGLKQRVASALGEADEQAFPVGLERRIQRRARRHRAAKHALRLAAPASIAAAVVGLLTVGTSNAVTPIVAESVERHIDNVRVDFASPDAGRIQRLLQGRLGHALRVPTFAGSPVSLRGARLVRMQRQPAAYLVYAGRRSKISVLALPDPHRHFAFSDERLPRVDGHPLMVARKAGYNVVLWRQDGVLYTMVSDLEPQEMMRLVRQPMHRTRPASPPTPPVVKVSY